MTTVGEWLSAHPHLPRLDAQLLLAAILDVDRAQVIAYPERQLQPRCAAALERNAQRLAAHEPLAYIIGTREFWGLTLAVSPAVLVPRPETELLVELALAAAAPQATVLDLGTGSGAIAIALAKERPDLTVTATDNCADALAMARRNADTHDVAIDFVQADWFDGMRADWDVIVANPPYVRPDDPHLAALAAEPQNALVSPPDGLHDLAAIVSATPRHLRGGGHLLLEHGFDQAAAVRAAMAQAGFTGVESKKDLARIERVTSGRMD